MALTPQEQADVDTYIRERDAEIAAKARDGVASGAAARQSDRRARERLDLRITEAATARGASERRESAVSAIERHRALMPAQPVPRPPGRAERVLEAFNAPAPPADSDGLGWRARMRARGVQADVIEALENRGAVA